MTNPYFRQTGLAAAALLASALTAAPAWAQAAADSAAATLDALYEAADLIGEVTDAEGRARLTAYFEERQFALESA